MRTKRNLSSHAALRALCTLVALAGAFAPGALARAQGQPSPAAPSPGAPETAAPETAAPPTDAVPAPGAPPPGLATPAFEAAPAPAVAVPAPAPAPALDPNEPLAGWNAGTAFLRAPDNAFVLLPSGRLQVDGYFFKTDAPGEPKNTFLLRRARLELGGWVGPAVFFSIGADFAVGPPASSGSPIAQTNLNATDNFVALAPWGDLAILQFGQYDAPFTLENRTSDKYFDFMERSVTVRAFGIPSNKEQGAMLHGINGGKNFYYSVGVFNGDGQNYRNVDGKFDVMGRAWIAPLSFTGLESLRDITVGGSYWTGDRNLGLALPSQSTQAGFPILSNSIAWVDPAVTTPIELHQQGRLKAWAVELNVPFAHKLGVRFEMVGKNQPLAAVDVSNAKVPAIRGGLGLKGWSLYGEAWYWAIGDDRIIGDPGLQLPTRLKKFAVKAPQRGLMFAARVDVLDEKLTQDADPVSAMLGIKGSGLGQTKLTALTLGANYWISKRFRTTFNYVLHHFGGDTSYVKSLNGNDEHEFLFRLAIAL